ncbi:glycoside hydrolase family 88/105 protein [Niastella populi]|uniref:Glucuronyl hydrolase n=1 Tax=Niastella populi TaxID=550983 RepID=A0A1V9FDB6_9BACT|nr:glycoside hydrolase family 88 protein [Niastella populi]OQP56257.1 glucuronyl hydrolase [Niastella populi]
MKISHVLFVISSAVSINAFAQQGTAVSGIVPGKENWSQGMAASVMSWWNDSAAKKPGKWSYDMGVVLKGMESLWKATGNPAYFNYIQKSIDAWVDEDGNIRGYEPHEYNIDHVNNGKQLLLLYRVTEKAKYKRAAEHLRAQLQTHPRTNEGSFWHKKVYPWQVWLDGLYMGQPFYAEYAMLFGEDTVFNDITRQFAAIERHARDPKTGLLYHGWDESKEQKWANKETGLSPHIWARALGWYGMAMVDALDYFPASHPGRDTIIGILNRFTKAITKVQDAKTGLWYDVIDMPNEPKNYFEASASAMLVYTMAKGVRKGYLPATYWTNAQKGYAGILKRFVDKNADGQVQLKGTVKVSGLGGKPYRDGSFAYYMSEPVIVNDWKGVGAYLLAGAEMENYPSVFPGKGKTVTVDYYFNHEDKKELNGFKYPTHYTWNEMSYNGFSYLGDIFSSYGAKLSTLEEAPTAANLAKSDVYIVVDPDGLKDNRNPNYVQEAHVKAIAGWVKKGGVLVLMANDSLNCDLLHFNKLANTFGINFSNRGRNFVKGNQYETGAVPIPAGNEVFKQTKKAYLKEISIIEAKAPAKPLVKVENDIIMAVAKYGKGTVFAVGDPWLYNEYTDGRKIPAEYENAKAAYELAKWLLLQTSKK